MCRCISSGWHGHSVSLNGCQTSSGRWRRWTPRSWSQSTPTSLRWQRSSTSAPPCWWDLQFQYEVDWNVDSHAYEWSQTAPLILDHLKTTNDPSPLSLCHVNSMCVSATFRRCGIAVSSLACGPSPTSAVHPWCPFSAHYRKFTLRSVLHPYSFTSCFSETLPSSLAWTKFIHYFNIKICFIFYRLVKSVYSAVDHLDWPRMWRKLASRWTRGIRPILNITMRTSNLSSALDCMLQDEDEPLHAGEFTAEKY